MEDLLLQIYLMSYKLNFLIGPEIVCIENEGKLNFQKAREFSEEATKLAHLNNCNKYLIDHTGTKLEHGIYKLHTDGAALEQFGFKSTDRIAIIISREKDGHYFSEKLSQEARWCSVKYFDSNEEAVLWLNNRS